MLHRLTQSLLLDLLDLLDQLLPHQLGQFRLSDLLSCSMLRLFLLVLEYLADRLHLCLWQRLVFQLVRLARLSMHRLGPFYQLLQLDQSYRLVLLGLVQCLLHQSDLFQTDQLGQLGPTLCLVPQSDQSFQLVL